jgi:hypothetical protein
MSEAHPSTGLPRRIRGALGRRARAVLRRKEEPFRLSDHDRRYLTSFYDDRSPLPADADSQLTATNPELVELKDAYQRLALPVTRGSRWNRAAVDSFLDLRYFRGETLFMWHYRELPRISQLKYFVFLRYVEQRDHLGLLERLEEDGAFGCWTFSYPGYGLVSRDLLESVTELCFLERELGLSDRSDFAVLDVGAGYGRLAHRMTAAFSGLRDYCCVDAIPEATFLSRYYLGHRGCIPPARVVRLDAIDSELTRGSFDLAVNIHSFSECPLEAIDWWIAHLRELEVPRLLVIPNDPDQLLSLEADYSREDFAPLLDAAGYELVKREPLIDDPAARELLDLRDSFHLYSLRV